MSYPIRQLVEDIERRANQSKTTLPPGQSTKQLFRAAIHRLSDHFRPVQFLQEFEQFSAVRSELPDLDSEMLTTLDEPSTHTEPLPQQPTQLTQEPVQKRPLTQRTPEQRGVDMAPNDNGIAGPSAAGPAGPPEEPITNEQETRIISLVNNRFEELESMITRVMTQQAELNGAGGGRPPPPPPPWACR